jgi:hypothetical protein
MSAFFRVLGGRAPLLALVLIAGAWPAAADTMLTLRNAAQPGIEVDLTEAELLAMPQITIRTRTVFTDGVIAFTGPLARDVVAKISAGSSATLHLIAINDYAIDIPLSDLTNFDVVLAMSADGQRLSLRDKGAIWLMYPLDDHPELQEQLYTPRLIWQLRTIELR